MIFAVHIACWQRLELFDLVLQQLQIVRAQLEPLHTLRVVVAGSEGDKSRAVAEGRDALYVEVQNRPLGAKVNAAVKACAAFRPDGVVGLGSDDLVTAGLFRHWASCLEHDTGYMGVRDLYCYDVAQQRLVYWPGYRGKRSGEAVGAGRCLSAALVEKLGWAPFKGELNLNLDASLMARLSELGDCYHTEVTTLADARACLLDVKSKVRINPMPAYGEQIVYFTELLRGWFGDEILRGLEGLSG